MYKPPIAYNLLLLLIFLFSACEGDRKKGEFSENENIGIDSPAYHWANVKKAQGAQEKIAHLNKALQRVENRDDSLILRLLDFKVFYHNSLKQYDSSLYFADSLLQVAQHRQDTGYSGMANYRKSKIYFYLDEQEEVFRHAFESRRLYLSIADSSNAGRRSLEMANAQARLGDYRGSQESATEALKYLKPEKDSSYISSAHNAIGISYRMQNFFEDARKEYRNALEFAPAWEDSTVFLNNLALVYQEEQDYPAAIEIYNELLERTGPGKPGSLARYLDNRAYTRWLQDTAAAVEEDLLLAKDIREEHRDLDGLIASYAHLSDYYRDNDLRLSKQYAERMLQTTIDFENDSAKLEGLEKLIGLSSGQEAKDFATRFIALNDSVNRNNLKVQNTFAKIRFDEERKQQEIFGLEAENTRQALEAQKMKNRVIIASLIGVILLLGAIFMFYYFRQRHRKEKIREVYKTESRISKVIHDELANDIFNIMSALEPVAPVPVIDKLENIYLRTRDISRENSDIDTGTEYLDGLLATLSNNTPEDAKLIIRGETEVNWEKISAEKKIVIYRVLQELMVNMKKYSQANLVAISFSEEGKKLNISYSDTGKGVDLTTSGKGGGLQNVENRIFSLNGRVNFESQEGKGFKVLIQIPV
jgi:signal transduction histidine kinase/tetratricopeptide (TPR) repeat protein